MNEINNIYIVIIMVLSLSYPSIYGWMAPYGQKRKTYTDNDTDDDADDDTDDDIYTHMIVWYVQNT